MPERSATRKNKRGEEIWVDEMWFVEHQRHFTSEHRETEGTKEVEWSDDRTSNA
jgi:hypothetical protein